MIFMVELKKLKGSQIGTDATSKSAILPMSLHHSLQRVILFLLGRGRYLHLRIIYATKTHRPIYIMTYLFFKNVWTNWQNQRKFTFILNKKCFEKRIVLTPVPLLFLLDWLPFCLKIRLRAACSFAVRELFYFELNY